MKKSIFSAVLALVIVALICVSCRSVPNEAEPVRTTNRPAQITERPAEITDLPVQITERPAEITDWSVQITDLPVQITERPAEITERPAQAFVDPLTAEARTRAQIARQQAINFQTPGYFPSEWDVIEAQFRVADNAAAYNAAATAFDELFGKTVPLYAQAREDEIMAARDELIGTGLTIYFPEYLRVADDMASEALDQFEAGDYLLARDTAARALNEYEDMLLAARVFLAWEEIIDRGFIPFDRDNFLNADSFASAAIDEFEAGNRDAARIYAQEAEIGFNAALSNGWTAFAQHRRASASRERELALAERANIASWETFREGESFLFLAESFFASGNFRDSALCHIEAEAMYAISRIETRERRLRAEEAIRMAEEAIEQSIETAMEAERVIEGGSR